MDEDTLVAPAEALDAALEGGPRPGGHNDFILSLPVTVQVVLGSTTLSVSNLMRLARGSIVSLDQRVGDPIKIMVSGRLIALGEIVMVDEDKSRYGVSLTEVIADAAPQRSV